MPNHRLYTVQYFNINCVVFSRLFSPTCPFITPVAREVMKRIQPTIRLRPRDRSNSGLDIHTDLEKRNTFSYLNNFPRLKNIILVGTAFIVVMVGLSYILDPATTTEWSSVAGQYLPFNTTQFGSAAKASILHYSHLVSDALQGTNETAIVEPTTVVKAPLPSLVTGYATALVTHSTGFDFIWQPPTERSERTGGGGIVFIAHACKRQPFEWFPTTPDCPTCDPMPVQVNIVRILRKNGFSVMAMNPVENPARCWHQNDRTQVGLAMQYIKEATVGFYGDTTDVKVSMYAIGVENGGVFLGNYAESLGLTYRTKLSAMLLMNSGIWHNNMKAVSYPAVAFLDLARNGELCMHNNATIQKLHSKQIPAVQYYSDPRPITRDYFSSIMSVNESILYHAELMKAGFLWPMNGVLLKDPTSDYYKRDMMSILSRVAPAVAASESINRVHSPLMQLLRLAWGYKEINDGHIDQIIKWFDSHGASAQSTDTVKLN